MLQQDYLKKMVNFNKMVFDNSYNVMTMFQDQAEKMTNMMIDQNPLGNAESKKMINDWCETCKKGRIESSSCWDADERDCRKKGKESD